MNKKARALSIMLAIFMLAVILAGCKKDEASSDPNTLSFSVTLSSDGVDNTKSQVHKEWVKLMEEKMGKKLNIKWNYIPSSDYDQKVQLDIASNELTDFLMTPLFYDTTDMAKHGQILELSQYKEHMPNYMAYLSKVRDGMERVTDADGKMYYFKETSTPRFEEDKGLLLQNTSAYRYDLFQKHNIKIPETLDDVYDAAKKLKELYPDKYPINTRWNDLRSLFHANHVMADVFWNGEEFVYGIFEDGYKEALQFANKLYEEKLLDPEYMTDTDDTLQQKALNESNFMWLAQWFTSPGAYTRLANDGKIFAVSFYPDNPKYGTAYQNATNGNTPDLGWGTYVINAKTKNPEELVKFVDLQYDPEVMRLITWGIEGVTYTLDEDGNPTFTEEFHKADDPWALGDKYGMRASAKHRPGLQISSDSKAFVDFAATDYTYFDGKYEEVPIEKNEFLRELPMPDNPYVPSWYEAPAIQFTQAESQEISEIMNPVQTFVMEMESNFVTGKESFSDWNKFTGDIKKMGNIDRVLEIYNEAAKRVTSK
ncbi:extracellular solute-binding protein [Lederbergia graminis]|uniref:Extracellular solute-binding protein n=1 Tax=Lederbergia graminis TaxID=735518 RepID=A0ABW0LHN3_9BACI